MTNSDSQPRKISLKLAIFFLLFWIASVCYGWSMEPFCGEFILEEESTFSMQEKLLYTQSSIVLFLFFGSIFQFLCVFLSIHYRQKIFLLLGGLFGSLVLFFLAMGIANNWLIVKLCFSFGSERLLWIPDIVKRQGWAISIFFLGSHLVATILLSGPFWRMRISATGMESFHQKTYPPDRVYSIIRFFAVLGFILYCAISFPEAIKNKNYLMLSTSAGFLVAMIQTLTAATIRIFPAFLNKLILLAGWIAFLVVIWQSFDIRTLSQIDITGLHRTGSPISLNFDKTGTPFLHSQTAIPLLYQTQLGPSILTLFGCILISGATLYLLGIKYSNIEVELAKDKNGSNRKFENLDPLAENEEVQIAERIFLEEKRNQKSPNAQRNAVTQISKSFLVVQLAMFLILGFGSHFIFHFTNPYILAATWDWDLSKLIAQSKVANNCNHYYESHDNGIHYTKERFLTPLFRIGKKSICTGFHTKFEFHLEVQPLVDQNQENIAALKKIQQFYCHTYPRTLSLQYTTQNPNGKFYLELANVVEKISALDVNDLTPEEQKKLLLSPYFAQPSLFRIRNMHISKGIGKSLYSWDRLSFENCEFNSNFNFPNDFYYGHQSVEIFDDCKLSKKQWLDLLTNSPAGRRIICVKQPSTSIPDFAVELLNRSEFIRFGNSYLNLYQNQGFLGKRQPVELWNFSVKKNANAMFKVKTDLTLEPRLKNGRFSTDFDSDQMTIQNGIITGARYDFLCFHFKPKYIHPKEFEWLWIVSGFLENRTGFYENFQQKMPKLKALSVRLSNDDNLDTDQQVEFFERFKRIVSSPKLKVLQIVDFFEPNSKLLEHCNVETVIIEKSNSLGFQNYVIPLSKNKRIKNFILIDPNFHPYKLQFSRFLNHSGLRKHWLSYLFSENYSVAKFPGDVYILKQDFSISDYRLPWKAIQKKYKLIRCPK